MRRLLVIGGGLALMVWVLMANHFNLREALIFAALVFLVIIFIRQGLGCLFSKITFFILAMFALALILWYFG